MDKRSDQTEAWFAVAAALFVLFSAMLDARVSAVASVVLLLGIGGYRIIHSRRT
ncbi:MAG: hypothetical protein U0521_23085 [Anaerolineae bacterium]